MSFFPLFSCQHTHRPTRTHPLLRTVKNGHFRRYFSRLFRRSFSFPHLPREKVFSLVLSIHLSCLLSVLFFGIVRGGSSSSPHSSMHGLTFLWCFPNRVCLRVIQICMRTKARNKFFKPGRFNCREPLITWKHGKLISSAIV